MSYIPEPVTRIDKYLAYIAGNMDVALPDHPITRKEHYLAAWAEKSGFEDVDVAGEPPLTLENGIGKPLKGLKVYGRSKQVTTTGAQLLEKNIVVHPPNGKVSTIVLFEGELSGTYTVSCELEGEAQYPTRAALEIIVDGVEKFCTINNHTVVSGTITKIECFAQNTYCDFTGTLNIMLNAGSAQLPWEPYTGGKPSPSPDYPQEIESVGDDGNLSVIVKNPNNEQMQSVSFSTPNGLPGIPITSGGNYTDVDRQQWICDEIDFGRRVYVQRVAYTTVDGDKIIFKEMGNYWNLPWHSSPGCIYAHNNKNNFFPSDVFNSNDNYSFIYTTPERMKEYFDTVDELNEFCKTQYDAGTPLTLYYALTTPVETPLTSDQLAAYKQLHTYKGTTIIDNDAGAYMSVKYEKMK